MLFKNTSIFAIAILVFLIATRYNAVAQVNARDNEKRGSIYFGIGSSVSFFGSSTIHIDQGSLRNNYELSNLTGSNSGTSNSSFSPFKLNYRLGYFFNYDQTWGIELNYDPAAYFVTDNQKIAQSGTVNGVQANNAIIFSRANGYYYSLNEAGLILINAVRRFGLYRSKTNKMSIDAFLKAGIGPVMPKASVGLYGDPNTPAHQLAGWNTGIEAAMRATLYRYVYVEIAAKYDYASFSGIKIYDGTASQTLNITSVIGTVGFTFPTTRRHPFFANKGKEHRIITIMPIYRDNAQ